MKYHWRRYCKTMRKVLLCLFLSIVMTAELTVGSYADIAVSDNTTEDAPGNGDSMQELPADIPELPLVDDPADTDDAAIFPTVIEDTDDTDNIDDAEDINTTEDPTDPDLQDSLSQETMQEGESILVSFYDVRDNVAVPFYDTATGARLLSDIVLTRTDDDVHLCDAFSDEDNAYYSAVNPQNPTPWLRFMPVRRGYQVTKWVNQNSGNEYDAYSKGKRSLYDAVNFASLKKDVSFLAKYSDTPYTFSIQYHLNGGGPGRGRTLEDLPAQFSVISDDIILPQPERAGFLFGGWYQDASFTKPISVIRKGTYLDSDAYGFVDSFHLYAKWTPISLPQVSLTSARYQKKGTIKLSYKKTAQAQGYEICFSTSGSFKKNSNTIDNAKKTSYVLSNLVQGKKYYFKVRAYAYDSTGERVFGRYSKVLSCKVKKGVKEYSAKDAGVNLKKASISKGSTLVVQASAPKRIKSEDDSYYLVKINPQTGKFENQKRNIVASLPKLKTLKYQIPLTDDTKAALLEGCYAIAIKTSKGYSLVSRSMLISNPEAAASYTAAFPKTKTPSKKGMQGAGGDSSLGVQHFFFNLNISSMFSSANDPNAVAYSYNGTTYYFNVQDYARTISTANLQGLVVTAQIGMSWPGSAKTNLISPGGRIPGHSYYSMNFQTSKSRNELEAVFCFMAQTFSTPDCHLDNWILGNEVNMHNDWYYAGNISRTKFMKNYADTFRGLYYAVKGYSKNARVYICLDHNWAGSTSVWGAKPFMDDFDTAIHALGKNIQWNLAYHLYPQNLNNAATWNDTLATNKTSSPYVTPKNLEVMTKYVKKHFGKKTRIILSEQGFTSNGGTDVQAAGIAYTFYKAQFDDMVDAIIFHRYQDDPSELNAATRQPLNYGICDSSGQAKPNSYHVFKFMDSPVYAQYTDACLKTIGISSWKKVNKNFNAKQLTTIP